MSKKSSKVEKDKNGTVFQKEEDSSKMEVQLDDVKDAGDYEESPVYIYYKWCVKCGICVEFCPTDTLGRKEDGSPYVKAPEKCIHCETCDRLCPNFAITGAKR